MATTPDVLHPQGLYNPLLRFAFTNITEEPLVSMWDGSPITVPTGATIELPHHLAVKLTKELVDKIIIGNAKLDEVTRNKENFRSPIGMSLGVPAARKVWEDQICRELAVDEESPQIQVMRAQIREELTRDLSSEVSKQPVHTPSSISEFAELGREEVKAEKAPIRLKTIK